MKALIFKIRETISIDHKASFVNIKAKLIKELVISLISLSLIAATFCVLLLVFYTASKVGI